MRVETQLAAIDRALHPDLRSRHAGHVHVTSVNRDAQASAPVDRHSGIDTLAIAIVLRRRFFNSAGRRHDCEGPEEHQWSFHYSSFIPQVLAGSDATVRNS